MSMKVIFPMAGLGSRFGYEFKPFIKATEDTFIETAKKSFDELRKPNYIFTFRNSQEARYSVVKKLKSMFPNDDIQCYQIEDSDGPLQTLQSTVMGMNLSGPSFVCDCDHRVDISPILEKYEEIKSKHKDFVIIPTWSIKPSEYGKWGKVRLDASGSIDGFCEKEYLASKEGVVKGMIGCYLFSNIAKVLEYTNKMENVSDMLKMMLSEGYTLITVDIKTVDFFGDPEALKEYRFKRAKKHTLFIDIDGTLLHQTTRELLPGTLEKLHEWKEQGHQIILTSACPMNRQLDTHSLLFKYNIPFDAFIGDLTPGPRIVINDKKPYIPYYAMADGIMLDRDTGISQVVLPVEAPVILKEFSGASFAKVYLVEDERKNKFVRKYISKSDKSLTIHVDKLKRQLEDMKRFNFMHKDIVPKILGSYESPNEFYYDLEYLENYQTLSSFDDDTVIAVVSSVLKVLTDDVYSCHKNIKCKTTWMNEYLSSKIYPKFQCISGSHYHLIFDTVKINGKTYPPIDQLLTNLEKHFQVLSPVQECPIHGDFTLENIMYNPDTHDFRLIDNEGSRYFDAREMDIGKLFQSLVCEYSSWKESCEEIVDIIDDFHYKVPECYLNIQAKKPEIILKSFTNNTDLWFLKGLFFMTTYFIRMMPFMKKKSEKHLVFTLLLCRVCLCYVLQNINLTSGYYPKSRSVERWHV